MKYIVAMLLVLSLSAEAQQANTYVNKGNEYYAENNFVAAEAQYRQALDVKPKNAEARYNLGNALMRQDKYKAAVEMYEGIATEDNNLKAASYYNAGVSYSRQKDFAKSVEAYKSALRINPADKQARENLQKDLHELQKQKDEQNNQKNKGGGGGMSENEADKKLKDLQAKEKNLHLKLQQGQNKGQGGGKDW